MILQPYGFVVYAWLAIVTPCALYLAVDKLTASGGLQADVIRSS